jgi:hypothetical protein
MTEPALEASSVSAPRLRVASMTLRSAALVSLLAAVALAALAFWPTRSFAPPRRPGLAAPVVFDEFVNPVSVQPASSPDMPNTGQP